MSVKLPQSRVAVRPLNECLDQIQRAKALRRSFTAESISLSAENPLLPPLLDAVRLFTELHIPYALIGGIAAMVYGRARFTDDVDFVAATGHELVLVKNPKVMQICHFDSASTGKLYHASGVEIDIWKDAFTDDIANRAAQIQLGTHTVRVADVHDLIAMKLRAGRLQDDYDIGEIIRTGRIQPEQLRPLVTPNQFSRFEQIQTRVRY